MTAELNSIPPDCDFLDIVCRVTANHNQTIVRRITANHNQTLVRR